VLVVLYAANLYAASEISRFRGRPVALVCGVSAVAPVLGPIVFLALPALERRGEEEEELAPSTAETSTFAVPNPPAAGSAETAVANPLQPDVPSAPTILKLSHAEPAQAATALPAAQIFQRGAFTFNRRFFETKFPGFFGVVRHGSDKDMVLLIKAARGEFVAERISRISANEFHAQVRKGEVTEEVIVPFTEIKEIQLKHKNA